MARMKPAVQGLWFLCLLPAVISCSDGNDPAPAGNDPHDPLVADHRSVDAFATVQPATFASVRENCRIFYGHTSHGSQIVSGMRMLADEAAVCALPDLTEVGGDLGSGGDLTWAATTRARLESQPGQFDLVIWSWCGGVSGNSAADIDAYLGAMAALEADYPDIVFVYMTGHLDGSGDAGNLKARNDQIRTWCRARGAVLFDFADIEAHDPDGEYHPDETDACDWCDEWCATHDCPPCDSCAHSHCFNCYRKGQAFWVLLSGLLATARL